MNLTQISSLSLLGFSLGANPGLRHDFCRSVLIRTKKQQHRGLKRLKTKAVFHSKSCRPEKLAEKKFHVVVDVNDVVHVVVVNVLSLAFFRVSAYLEAETKEALVSFLCLRLRLEL